MRASQNGSPDREQAERFRQRIAEALADCHYIARWGDGGGGYLIEVFMEEMRNAGICLEQPSEGKRKARIPGKLSNAIMRRDGRECVACGSKDDLTIDHIKPESKGGSLDPSNLQTLCCRCNSIKGVREDFQRAA